MSQQGMNGYLEDGVARTTPSEWQLEVSQEAASGREEHGQLLPLRPLISSRLFLKLRIRKNGFPITKVGSKKRVLFWFHKTGENEMKQTVGFHFVFPCFREPKSVPKTGTKIVKKKLFFYTIKKNPSTRTAWYAIVVHFLLREKVRRIKWKTSGQHNGGGLSWFMCHL